MLSNPDGYIVLSADHYGFPDDNSVYDDMQLIANSCKDGIAAGLAQGGS